MKSIKPGRGPSMLGGIGSVGMAIFGVIWTIVALSMGAGGLFALFGVFFVVMAVVQAFYHFHNATGENRYSEYDITEEGEERDPLGEHFAPQKAVKAIGKASETGQSEGGFCPYCGQKTEAEYLYCRKCGRKLSD